MGRTVDELTHPDDRRRYWADLTATRTSERRHLEVRKRYLHRDGHVVSAKVWVASMPPQGQQPGIVLAHVMSCDEPPVHDAGADRA